MTLIINAEEEDSDWLVEIGREKERERDRYGLTRI